MAGKQAKPAPRRGPWLAALAVLLAVCTLGCAVSPIFQLPDPTEAAETSPTARPDSSDAPMTAEPSTPEGSPALSFDRETGTLRIVGTEGYEGLDLTPANEAKTLEVEDDEYQLTLSVPVLKAALEQSAYYNPNVEGFRVSDVLPRFLLCLDGSTPIVRLFIAAHAPNEEVVARTEKTVRYVVNYAYNYKNGPDQIELNLGKSLAWHNYVYTLALIDAKKKNWPQLGFAYLVHMCVDPYSYGIMGLSENVENRDYYYFDAYYRAGGSGELADPTERRLLLDANAWYNLVYGRDWPGSDAECGAICDVSFFSGDMRMEGSDLSLSMATSLLNYLANRCGINRVEAYCFDTCSFEEAFGMDFAAARADWEESLLDRFGEGDEAPLSLSAPR